MDYLGDSSPLFEGLPPKTKNCEQLFDELFNDDDNSLTVKRPVKTYSKRILPLTVLLPQSNHSDCDTDDESGEEETCLYKDPLFKKPSKPRARKKKTYPPCTKDTVLNAFQKAIEMNELPDFDKIEKQPLNIVQESERPKRRTRQSSKPKSTTTITTTVRKSTRRRCSKTANKENTVIESKKKLENNENVESNVENVISEKTQEKTVLRTRSSYRKPLSERPTQVSQATNDTIDLCSTESSTERPQKVQSPTTLNSSRFAFGNSSRMFTSTPKVKRKRRTRIF